MDGWTRGGGEQPSSALIKGLLPLCCALAVECALQLVDPFDCDILELGCAMRSGHVMYIEKPHFPIFAEHFANRT